MHPMNYSNAVQALIDAANYAGAAVHDAWNDTERARRADEAAKLRTQAVEAMRAEQMMPIETYEEMTK